MTERCGRVKRRTETSFVVGVMRHTEIKFMRKPPKKYEKLLDRSYRWPKKGARLLRKTIDWNTGADFSGDVLSRHVHIWRGYMSAGDALVEYCRRNPQERHSIYDLSDPVRIPTRDRTRH
jgi:hypothetical protein